MNRTALVVEDEAYLHQALSDALADAGLTAQIVTSGGSALEACTAGSPDIILLDLCLPDMDGLDVCRQLRSRSAVPIVMLTARHSEVDRIVGLELGADDYVVKPFHRGELVARIRAILRRVNEYPQQDGARELAVPPVYIRKDRRTVTCRGQNVDLTPKEFDLLCALASRPHEVIPSRELLWEVWQYPDGIRTRTLDVHIGRLRGKLEIDRKHPEIIVTVPGVGYKIQSVAV
ncbi:MAG: response regulator transcription factor [Armatimonadetes bacterium]|nr:response regulator transcription factor [Armatimonadota bacterium]